MSALLEVSALTAGYGPVQVLQGIDLQVEEGQVVVILGANGAGKTTTLRAISGMIPRTGTAIFEGQGTTRLSPDAIVRLGMAHVPQGRGTFPELTVEDNLRAGAYVRHDAQVREDLDLWFSTFPRLDDRRSQRAGRLSGGEQQMLAIARALMSRPRLLLCDEPSLGLAPIVTQTLFEVIRQLNRDRGLSVLLVEQSASLALKIAHRAYLLETGTIVTSGTAEEIASEGSIRKAYLGY